MPSEAKPNEPPLNSPNLGGRTAGIVFRIAQLKAGRWRGLRKTRAFFETTYFAGLRGAGMPEE